MEERRGFITEGIRTVKTDTGTTISGYGIVFNKWSQDLGGFYEVIKRQAIDGIKWDGVTCLFNHNADNILGRVPGTMRISVDDYGVLYSVDLPDSSLGQNVKVAIERRDVKGSSFGFQISAGGDSWEKLPSSGMWKRTITSFKKILDISPVVFPAYLDTTVNLKSLQRQDPGAANRISLSLAKLQLEILKHK